MFTVASQVVQTQYSLQNIENEEKNKRLIDRQLM